VTKKQMTDEEVYAWIENNDEAELSYRSPGLVSTHEMLYAVGKGLIAESGMGPIVGRPPNKSEGVKFTNFLQEKNIFGVKSGIVWWIRAKRGKSQAAGFGKGLVVTAATALHEAGYLVAGSYPFPPALGVSEMLTVGEEKLGEALEDQKGEVAEQKIVYTPEQEKAIVGWRQAGVSYKDMPSLFEEKFGQPIGYNAVRSKCLRLLPKEIQGNKDELPTVVSSVAQSTTPVITYRLENSRIVRLEDGVDTGNVLLGLEDEQAMLTTAYLTIVSKQLGNAKK
jgi:hypothetical protein